MSPRPEAETVFTVSAINELVGDVLSKTFGTFSVRGEVSGLKRSGHVYFTLKDETSALSCIVWRSRAALCPPFNEGDRIIARGQLSVYSPRGTYSLVCDSIEPEGEGAILAELERRKRAYLAEGLFDPARKRLLPKRIERIGIITSSTGAAVHDIISVLRRRNCPGDIILLPAAVQGENAAGEIARRIAQANSFAVADVLLVGRGGGSIEDLLPFSDDRVVRAVAASGIPVISCVGHEVDNALCDYAADIRAATPTAAAEILSNNADALLSHIVEISSSMRNCAEQAIRKARNLVNSFSLENVKGDLRSRLAHLKQSVMEGQRDLSDNIKDRTGSSRKRLENGKDLLINKMQAKATGNRHAFERALAELGALSPYAVLKRGYSISVAPDGSIIKSADRLPGGQRFSVRFADGAVKAVSEGKDNG